MVSTGKNSDHISGSSFTVNKKNQSDTKLSMHMAEHVFKIYKKNN